MQMQLELGFFEFRIFSSWFSWFVDFSFFTSDLTAFSDHANSIWFSIDPLRYWSRRLTEVFPNINFNFNFANI